MTTIAFKNGRVLFLDGRPSTCCCPKCAEPCPDYCCDSFPAFGVFYNGGDASLPLTFEDVFDCDNDPQADMRGDFIISCDGWQTQTVVSIYVTGRLQCADTDENHPTHPGCGRNCTIVDPVIATSEFLPPCFDAANIIFLYCPDPCP